MSQEKKIEYNVKHVAFVFDTDNVNAVLVTEDGNVFKADAKGQSFCKDHCRRLNIKFQEVTREEFEAANPKAGEAPKLIPLSKLNKPDLVEMCNKAGLEVLEEDTKAILINKIETAVREASNPSAEGDKTSEAGNAPEGDDSNNNTPE